MPLQVCHHRYAFMYVHHNPQSPSSPPNHIIPPMLPPHHIPHICLSHQTTLPTVHMLLSIHAATASAAIHHRHACGACVGICGDTEGHRIQTSPAMCCEGLCGWAHCKWCFMTEYRPCLERTGCDNVVAPCCIVPVYERVCWSFLLGTSTRQYKQSAKAYRSSKECGNTRPATFITACSLCCVEKRALHWPAYAALQRHCQCIESRQLL